MTSAPVAPFNPTSHIHMTKHTPRVSTRVCLCPIRGQQVTGSSNNTRNHKLTTNIEPKYIKIHELMHHIISAVKRLIASKIKVCLSVYIYYIYINALTYSIYFDYIYMY